MESQDSLSTLFSHLAKASILTGNSAGGGNILPNGHVKIQNVRMILLYFDDKSSLLLTRNGSFPLPQSEYQHNTLK